MRRSEAPLWRSAIMSPCRNAPRGGFRPTFNVKLAQRRIFPLALWGGGEGTGMAAFVIRGGNMPCPFEWER